MGYGATATAGTISADIVLADVEAIVNGIAGAPGSDATLGDLQSALGDIEAELETLGYYLSGSYSGPLTDMESSLSSMDSYLSDVSSNTSYLWSIDSYLYNMESYLSGNYSGPLTYMESYLSSMDDYLSDVSSDTSYLYSIYSELQSIRAKTDLLTFDGSNNLNVNVQVSV